MLQNDVLYLRFEVLTAAKMLLWSEDEVHPEDGGGMFLQNTDNHLQLLSS
jgi:hypothetical protein